MAIRKYSGGLTYEGGNFVEIKSLTVGEREMAFQLASVTENYGLWTTKPGTKARRVGDRTYVAQAVDASQEGVVANTPYTCCRGS